MQITSQYGILTPSIVSIGTVCYVYHRSFNSPRSCWKIRPKLSGPLDRTEAHLPSLWSTTHKMIITTPHRPLFHFFLGCCNTLSRFFYIFGKVSWRRRIIKLMGSHGHPIGLHLITGWRIPRTIELWQAHMYSPPPHSNRNESSSSWNKRMARKRFIAKSKLDETRACLDYRGRLANNWRENFCFFFQIYGKYRRKKNELLRSMNLP